MIFKLVGHKLGDIDVLDIKSWVMHAEVAEKYISNEGRVILVGDAAHCFPPAGGFGKIIFPLEFGYIYCYFWVFLFMSRLTTLTI